MSKVSKVIKIVFFDLFQTLVNYEPPREELQARALADFGIKVAPETLLWPLAVADEYIYQEMARSSLSRRSKEAQMAVCVGYESRLLAEAGIEVDKPVILGLLDKMRGFDTHMVLYDDVLPALTDLKERGIRLGLISNFDQDITALFEKLGLSPLLEVVVTSQDAGYNKPHPEIFKAALQRAGVDAAEAAYVGDQYQVDVEGANGVGMKGILLDRNGYYQAITGSPRLQSLAQVVEYL